MQTKVSALAGLDELPRASSLAARTKTLRERRFSRLDRVLSWIILACGLCTVVVGARQIVTARSLVPMGDEWQEIDAIAIARGHPPLAWLWSLHNEHRIVFYRLLLLADVNLFHGRHGIYFWAILLVQGLFLAALAWTLRFAGVNGNLWRALLGLAAFALFCPSQWENFGWAFQISFLLPGLFALLALAALFKYEHSVQHGHPRRIYLGCSIAAAGGATYSVAAGVALWPLLLLVALLTAARYEVLAAYTASGLLFVTAYLQHYASPTIHSSPLQSIRHPLLVLEYMAAYLGVIFPAWVKIRALLAVASGALGMLAALLAAFWVVARQRRKPLPVLLLALICFVGITATMTALGRIGLGLSQAFSSRYQTFNLLFWFSLAALALLAAEEFSSRLRTLMLGSVSLVMLAAFAVFPLGLRASQTRTQQAEAAATALLAQVPDQQALAALYIDTPLVWRDAEYFREQRLFMFGDFPRGQMGQSLSSVYAIESPQQCRGSISVIESIAPEDLLPGDPGGALRVLGWAFKADSRTPVRRLVLVGDQKIVGFAASVAGPLSAKHSDLVRTPEAGRWLGFARYSGPPAQLAAYALDKETDAACLLSTAAPLR